MKRPLLIILISFCCLAGYGQYGFGEGFIVTKRGDTIRCQVEMAVNYANKIAFKMNPQGEEQFIAAEDVRLLTTPANYWRNLKFGKKERLMRLVVDGEVKLFTHVTINRETNVNGTTLYSPPTVLYVLEKSESFYELKRKDFKETIAATMSDCKTVMDKVNAKEYKYEDIERLVGEYNSCH